MSEQHNTSTHPLTSAKHAPAPIPSGELITTPDGRVFISDGNGGLVDISSGRILFEYQTLKKERDEARAEVERLKATVNQALTVRPEPSRLEIAAMFKAGWFANRDADFNATDHGWWIKQADALIAAAKEAK